MSKNDKSKKVKRAKQISVFCILILILLVSIFGLKLYTTKRPLKNTGEDTQLDKSMYNKENKDRKTEDAIPQDVLNFKPKTSDSNNDDLRKFPYPYNAMLALCSDIDDATLDDFKAYHEFLNTKEKTSYGEGLGLDVGDSMWLYMADSYPKPSKQGHGSDAVMTYYKGIDITKKNDADEIIHFIKCGWIDCIHTFGDFSTKNEKGTSFTRQLAIDGWKTLNDIGFKPKVWINHGNRANVQNFGAGTTSTFMSYQQGDNPKSVYYHTDITIPDGIKYVWNSINSNIFGMDYPLFKISLRDGHNVWGFSRYTNILTKGKIDWDWTPKDQYRQLTKDNLDGIVKSQQYSIVAQHFGVATQNLFTQQNIQALTLLKQYQDNKKILIAKTTRLLDYALAHKYLMYNKVAENNITYINIVGINDPLFGKIAPQLDNLRGITFYTDDAKNTVLLLNGNRISQDEIQINSADETGKASVSIKWFSPDYTDYTKKYS
jgi:hypothetical protein